MNNQAFNLSFKNIVGLLVLAIFFISDRLLKALALFYPEKTIINNLLNFNFVPNYNISFSLPLNGPWLNILISGIIFAIIYFLTLNYKRLSGLEFISFIALLLGAISNLFDRFNYGFVIDYLDLRWFTIFNLADVLISISSIILLISLFKKDSK